VGDLAHTRWGRGCIKSHRGACCPLARLHSPLLCEQGPIRIARQETIAVSFQPRHNGPNLHSVRHVHFDPFHSHLALWLIGTICICACGRGRPRLPCDVRVVLKLPIITPSMLPCLHTRRVPHRSCRLQAPLACASRRCGQYEVDGRVSVLRAVDKQQLWHGYANVKAPGHWYLWRCGRPSVCQQLSGWSRVYRGLPRVCPWTGRRQATDDSPHRPNSSFARL